MSDWQWIPGNWKDLINNGELYHIGDIELDQIGSPWSWNIQAHLNYDRLFWDIHRHGLKTPLLVRPWTFPFKAKRNRVGCRFDGNRLDNSPSPVYKVSPNYELLLGNMRFCAIYTQGYKTAPCVMIPNSECDWNVEDIWQKYHPVFEGNYYDNPNYGMPSKYTQGFG